MKTNIKTAKKFITDKYITSKLNGKGEVKADVDELVKMFKQYAEQFIDLAAEKAETIERKSMYQGMTNFITETYVDKKSILKVKQLIK